MQRLVNDLIDPFQSPGLHLWLEIKCDDGSVVRALCQVGACPGEGGHLVIVHWASHSPELLTSTQESPGDKLHVQGPIPLVTNHLVKILKLTLRPWQRQVQAVSYGASRYGKVAAIHLSLWVILKVIVPGSKCSLTCKS